MIERTSRTSRFNIGVLGLRGMEKVVGKRDDFAMDALFYFEQAQRFEYRDDMFNFSGSSDCASKGVLQ